MPVMLAPSEFIPVSHEESFDSMADDEAADALEAEEQFDDGDDEGYF